MLPARLRGSCLSLALATGLAAAPACAESAVEADYPELRERADPELRAALDAALAQYPRFWKAVREQRASVVVADVTDLHHPRVTSYNPDLMLYAASLPKIGIVLGAFAQIERGEMTLDAQTRESLIRMIRYSSNRHATALLNAVGFENLAEILQSERYGKLYDPEHGGGIWVGKAFDKSPVWKRDPLHGISHGASAMQAARFYYLAMAGKLFAAEHMPVVEEIFSEPGVEHKFVKGLKGREGVKIYRKSGTWAEHHADSGVIVREEHAYIVVAIGRDPTAGQGLVNLIRAVDDVMVAEQRKRSQSPGG
jgi:beta-lactamase class A